MTLYFKKNNGIKLPVNHEYYLNKILSPTSIGTNYWDSPPPSSLDDSQKTRILLQLHQLIDLLISNNINFTEKKFLDIGTGNGLVPRLFLEMTDISYSVGIDPYLDGEHSTSWQQHDRDKTFSEIIELLKKSNDELDFDNYSKFNKKESYALKPAKYKIPNGLKSKKYKFEQIGAHELSKINEKFDIIYCKAIEHIPDWDTVFNEVSKVINDDGVFYLKHRSFFSYLGAHRYSSTDIPWGHVLLSDEEFKTYAQTFHQNRAEEMINFFFNGLAYPRHSISEMIEIGMKYNLSLKSLRYEPTKKLPQLIKFTNDIPNFFEIIHDNYPKLSLE